MAGPLALALVLGVASLSFLMRAAGPLLPAVPASLSARTQGLAPALLAALVAIQLTARNGLIHFDVRLPAVLLAIALAAARTVQKKRPTSLVFECALAGAVVAAVLRGVFHLA